VQDRDNLKALVLDLIDHAIAFDNEFAARSVFYLRHLPTQFRMLGEPPDRIEEFTDND
jgi:hypothetical protein